MVVKPSKEMRETLDLPEVSQIGIVVRDLEKAVDYYQNLCGLGPFVQPEITFIEKFYDDIPTDFEMNMAFCSLGPVEMELIQPVTPPTVYHDFIEKRGFIAAVPLDRELTDVDIKELILTSCPGCLQNCEAESEDEECVFCAPLTG